MSFTLFLPSTQGVKAPLPTGSAEITYNFDWNAIRPLYGGNYEISFCFISEALGTNFNRTITPLVNWGALPYGYELATQNGAYTTSCLGTVSVIREDLVNVYVNYTAYANQNVPIHIQGLPHVNQFTVTFEDFRRKIPTPFLFNADYMLSIHFRAILTLPKQIQGTNCSFSVILNSKNGQALGQPAVLNSLTEFNIDWSILSEHKGRFRLSSCFTTGALPSDVAVDSLNRIELDLGCNHNSFIPRIEYTAANHTNIISIFKPVVTGVGGQFGYSRDQNLPVILNSLPQLDQFRTQFLRFDGTQMPDFITDWCLTLFFEAI